MTSEANEIEPTGPEPVPAAEDLLADLRSRVNVLESRVHNLEERLLDVRRDEIARKQRQLLWRIILLAVLLAGYFALRAFKQ